MGGDESGDRYEPFLNISLDLKLRFRSGFGRGAGENPHRSMNQLRRVLRRQSAQSGICLNMKHDNANRSSAAPR